MRAQSPAKTAKLPSHGTHLFTAQGAARRAVISFIARPTATVSASRFESMVLIIRRLLWKICRPERQFIFAFPQSMKVGNPFPPKVSARIQVAVPEKAASFL